MVKYREILRLTAMGVSQNSIAYSCGCAQSTVSDVLRAARAHQLSRPLPEEMDDAAIRAVIYPRESRKAVGKAAIDRERIASGPTGRGISVSLLWNEHCDEAAARGEEPCMYYAFCRGHRGCAQRHDVRMRIEHRAAEAMQADWAGDTGKVIDPDTGEILKVSVLAACPPYSNCLHAEGFYKTDEEAWITAHVRMFPITLRGAVSRNADPASGAAQAPSGTRTPSPIRPPKARPPGRRHAGSACGFRGIRAPCA